MGMKRLTFAGLLLGALACSDSGASGELSYDYVYNSNDHEFHKNTLQGGELIASELITADEYDRESGSALSAAQVRRSAELTTCQLAPGDYLLEYSVLADSCNIGPLQSELFTLGAGSIVGASTPATGDCVDEVMVETCPAAIRRRCQLSAVDGLVSLDITIAIDAATGAGTAMIRGLGSDPSAGSAEAICASSQRVAIERLD